MKNYTKIIILALVTVLGCKTDHALGEPTDLQGAKIDTTLLYGVWDSERGGDADFRITKKEFYLVDFFETSEYKIEGNKIEIKGSEFFQNGEILKMSEDSLKIRWIEQDIIVDYWKFNN
jgi:hypothetical protein